VVINDQDGNTSKIGGPITLILDDFLEANRENKGASLADFACDADFASHQCHHPRD
jgi:hypothetical protein